MVLRGARTRRSAWTVKLCVIQQRYCGCDVTRKDALLDAGLVSSAFSMVELELRRMESPAMRPVCGITSVICVAREEESLKARGRREINEVIMWCARTRQYLWDVTGCVIQKCCRGCYSALNDKLRHDAEFVSSAFSMVELDELREGPTQCYHVGAYDGVRYVCVGGVRRFASYVGAGATLIVSQGNASRHHKLC